MRRLLAGSVAAIGALALIGLGLWWPRGPLAVDRESLGFAERVDATVDEVETEICPSAVPDDGTLPPEGAPECVVVTASLTSGPDAGDTATLEAAPEAATTVAELEPGDRIVLNDGGADLPAQVRYSFADMQRSMPLALLAVVFALVVIALGRLKGLLALAGIVVSLGVLLVFIFPALLAGAPPVGVALTGATVIAFCTLYLAHGVNDRTTVALLGTLGSLALTAALAIGFSSAARLSGLASDESAILLSFAPGLDFRGLLLAAVIVGTLGVLDDVTVTQVSAVWELDRTDPHLSARELYRAGIRIGRDHIASTVNTLVLAYAAAALPLLLIFTQSGLAFGDVLVTETIAVEIVQTMVGSIGLVASVPLTTALACWVIRRSSPGSEHAWTEPYPEDVLYERPVPAGDRTRRPPAAADTFWTNDPW
jgi:uncharacterized membrane protein